MHTLQSLKSLFIPTPVQAVLSFCLALAILFITHAQLFVAILASKAYIQQDDVGAIVNARLADLSHIHYAEKFSVGLFWAVVASIVYIAAVVINNALIEARNQYVIDTQFANERGHRKFWIRTVLMRVGWFILFLALLNATATKLLPIWFNMFGAPFINGAHYWWTPVAAIWGLTFNIYLLWMLAMATRSAEYQTAS